jgi:hypothetical protein
MPGLEINIENSKYMMLSFQQNESQDRDIKKQTALLKMCYSSNNWNDSNKSKFDS